MKQTGSALNLFPEKGWALLPEQCRRRGGNTRASGVTRSMIAHRALGASHSALTRLSDFFGIAQHDLVDGERSAAVKKEFGAYFERISPTQRMLIIAALRYKDQALKRAESGNRA